MPSCGISYPATFVGFKGAVTPIHLQSTPTLTRMGAPFFTPGHRAKPAWKVRLVRQQVHLKQPSCRAEKGHGPLLALSLLISCSAFHNLLSSEPGWYFQLVLQSMDKKNALFIIFDLF